MPIVKTLAKGQVVIPKEIRQALGIAPGTKLHVRVEGKEVVLFPLPADPIRALRGVAKGGPSLTKALLEDRREELKREEKRKSSANSRPFRFSFIPATRVLRSQQQRSRPTSRWPTPMPLPSRSHRRKTRSS